MLPVCEKDIDGYAMNNDPLQNEYAMYKCIFMHIKLYEFLLIYRLE